MCPRRGWKHNDRGLVQTAGAIRKRGIGVVRFNFLYKEKKSGRPDPMPRLKECVTAVVARTRAEVRPKTLIIGGRSMGGRAASMLAAEGFECDGLLPLAYPLHPPGKPDELRDAHLPAIKVPGHLLQWHSRSILHAEPDGRSIKACKDELGDALGGGRYAQLSRAESSGQNRRQVGRHLEMPSITGLAASRADELKSTITQERGDRAMPTTNKTKNENEIDRGQDI